MLIANRRDGSGVRIGLGGTAMIIDRKSDAAHAIEGRVKLFSGKKYAFRLDHEGGSLTYSIDGKKVLKVPSVGTLTGGRLGVFVHASSEMWIYRVKAVGRIRVPDPAAARARFAKRVADSMWSRGG